MKQPTRTYTLDQAAEELHISRETLERLIPNLPNSSSRSGEPISEDELNQIVDLMNDPNNAFSEPKAGS
jgi:hypothetical protein